MKEKINKLIRPVGIGFLVLGGMVLLGFVERTADRTPITELFVRVKGEPGVHFIDEAGVRNVVMEQGTPIIGAPMGELNALALETRLRNIPCVASAEVYHTMDGDLHVTVRQREPIVRVLNGDGTSFYIDEEGWSMPTDPDHTARVLVVTGWLKEPGAINGVRSVFESDSIREHCLSDDIHRLAAFIRADPLWNALIDQVVVNAEGEFELVPRVGGHRVLIGDGSALEKRFAKLRLFYKDGMPKADWRRYARIDLRFADQIVCTKRTSPNNH